jgi:hypothetical protein
VRASMAVLICASVSTREMMFWLIAMSFAFLEISKTRHLPGGPCSAAFRAGGDSSCRRQAVGGGASGSLADGRRARSGAGVNQPSPITSQVWFP